MKAMPVGPTECMKGFMATFDFLQESLHMRQCLGKDLRFNDVSICCAFSLDARIANGNDMQKGSRNMLGRPCKLLQ